MQVTSLVRSTALLEARLRWNAEVFVITSLTNRLTLAPAQRIGIPESDSKLLPYYMQLGRDGELASNS